MKIKAVLSVTGKDNVGIIANVSALCAKYGANIIDISQTVLKDYFAMIMIVEIDKLTVAFTEFADLVSAYDLTLNLLDKLTSTADIWELHCTISEEAAVIAYNKIFSEK